MPLIARLHGRLCRILEGFSRKTCLGNNFIFSPSEEAIPKSAFDVEALHTIIHYKNVTLFY